MCDVVYCTDLSAHTWSRDGALLVQRPIPLTVRSSDHVAAKITTHTSVLLSEPLY